MSIPLRCGYANTSKQKKILRMKAAFTARVNFRDTSRGSREYFLLVEKF